VDDTLRVDLTIRVLMLTARQLVEKFGAENCSSAVQAYKDSNAGGIQETYLEVAHVICKGTYFNQDRVDPKLKAALGGNIPWLSILYEVGQFNDKKGILRQSLFFENPLICGRWRTVGENIYGESPAMDILGSTMSLQVWEERLAQACEKQFNPPMVASSEIDPRRLTTLPGEFSFVDGKDATKAFAPAYMIDFKLDQCVNQIKRIEDRIREGMFVNVFQQFIDSDRREQTAEEIRAKMQEKMQVLGPVVERNVEEVHAPAVMRILGIAQRRGLLPPAPEAIKKGRAKVKPVFESIQSAAQRMLRINNVAQVLQLMGQEAALAQGIMDNFNTDAIARGVARDASLPADYLNTANDVKAIRDQRAKAQQAAQMADNAQKLAGAAQAAGNTPVGAGSNLLEKVMPNLAR